MQPGSPEENILQELTEPSVIEQGAYILIAAGAFIFIISFLGNCRIVIKHTTNTQNRFHRCENEAFFGPLEDSRKKYPKPK